MQYFSGLVAREIYNDVCFLTERDELLWWYDGERIEFRTLNYAKILKILMREPIVTLDYIQKELGINMSAVKKLVNHLLKCNYIERKKKEGSWRVFITPSIY
mgnify:FL=1